MSGYYPVKCIITIIFLISAHVVLFAQLEAHMDFPFTRADTIRGALRPERTSYDVHYYQLNLYVNPEFRHLMGYVDIHFNVVEDFSRMQVDLYRNMQVQRVVFRDKEVVFEWDEDAIFIELPELRAGERDFITVYYEGVPTEAKNAPWDGGFVWKQDAEGNPWIGVACQGAGASLWWPCKDHLSDEPDSMRISLIVPDSLMAISNGRLEGERPFGNNMRRFDWVVTYPINSYNVSLYIGKYVSFEDTYISNTGDSLDLKYYVLPVNLEKARKHFLQVHDVLRVFEKFFGKYPFWEDSYKLVESPYLGMEHQSAIAYGNLYRRGYLGGNIPSDMDFDYIILHESGHEYFGNALSAIDLADMWLHESFTTYLESLYVAEMMDYESSLRYLMNQRAWINNRQPIVGLRGINWIRFNKKSTDMYYKGAWILHTMRHMVMDDDKWFDMLRGFYDEYKFQSVISEDFFFYASEFLDMDLAPFFQQYFYTTEIPEFQYKFRQGADGVHLEFRIEAITPDLEIPIFFEIGSESISAMASNEWRSMWMPVRQDLEIRMPRNKFLMYFTRK